ncbi:hypothetical protein KP509_14G054700 [Ceratopteris richardii]|uniref:Uncharacterized protein n=1 Tax=Ceratopteris richardii TaxID=49495 RepID=A0A8T2TCW4_CERRI|nr:hypothetical protein KP509_14G054700 [Ceratopteris richardii]
MSRFPKHITQKAALKCATPYLIFDWVDAYEIDMMNTTPCSHSLCEYYLIVMIWRFMIGSFPHILLMFMFGGSICLFVHILGFHKNTLIWSILIDDMKHVDMEHVDMNHV